jgi:hypothetical protein
MRIVKMKPTSPLHDDVRKESEKSARIGRRTIVYVGAKWCDPCVRFLKAVKAGKLDQEFGTVDILKFDLDKHGKRLKEAGYQSRLIPLFALPKADGRASDYDFSGSIKGDGAMANIMPRLRELLTNPSAINAATLSCCDGPTPKEAGAQKKGLKPLKTLELDRALGQKKPADQKRPVKTK